MPNKISKTGYRTMSFGCIIVQETFECRQISLRVQAYAIYSSKARSLWRWVERVAATSFLVIASNFVVSYRET